MERSSFETGEIALWVGFDLLILAIEMSGNCRNAILPRIASRKPAVRDGSFFRVECACSMRSSSVLHLDGPEAEDLAGSPLPTRQASLDFAAELVARKVAQVVVWVRGAEGSVHAIPGHRLFYPAAEVRVVSKIGAGDSSVLLAALVIAVASGNRENVRLPS